MSLDITVALTPQGMDIDREMAYIKSALLYADKVNLISPIAYLVKQIAYNDTNNIKQIAELFNVLIPYAKLRDPQLYSEASALVLRFNDIIKKSGSISYVKKMSAINAIKNQLVPIIQTAYNSVGYSNCTDLKKLVDSGQVSIAQFRTSLTDINQSVMEYFQLLTQSIKNTNPLFDEQSYQLINAALKSKIIRFSDSEKAKITHVGLVDNYLQRLPSFEEASFDELIDIKNELSKPLVRFRSKMISYSEEIKSLPWDKDFENDCNALFLKEIEPSLLEIEEATQNNSFKSNLGSKFLTQEGTWKSYSGIVVGIATTGVIAMLNDFSLDNYSILTGAAASILPKFVEACYVHEKNKSDIENNELYFYYKAKNKLENRK